MAHCRKRVHFYKLAQNRELLLCSWAKLLCRISCVASAMRLPVLCCWMWRGWRSVEGKGTEAETGCAVLLSAVATVSRFSLVVSDSHQNSAAKEVQQWFLGSIFPQKTVLQCFMSVPRILTNDRVATKTQSGTSWRGTFCLKRLLFV